MNLMAVNLVALGVVLLAFSGMLFSAPGPPLTFAQMHFGTAESHVIPPVVGTLMVLGGIALLMVNPKRTA